MVVGCGRVGFDPRGLDATGMLDGASTCRVHLGPGRLHICESNSSGLAMCWGDNSLGQLTDPTLANHATPYVVAFQVLDIDGGRFETCAAHTTGETTCWGEGTSGQLGDGNSMTSSTPVTVTNLLGAVDTAPAAIHACARTGAGDVWCWGDGSSGRLGNGLNTSSPTPVQVTISGAIALSSGGSHTCAILATGDLRCWGFNMDGQIGNNSTTDVVSPVAPMGIGTVRSVSMRDQTTCAVQIDGAVYCWGRNDLGQVGKGDMISPVLLPTQVQTAGGVPLVGAAQVAVGIEHACALVAGGVWCWGSNGAGQLGDGGGSRAFAAPTQPFGIEIVEIASAAYTTCAVDINGGVWCWGQGTEGEIGNGAFQDATTPVHAFDACP